MSNPAISSPLRLRLLGRSSREKIFLGSGAAAAVIATIHMLPSSSIEASVELGTATSAPAQPLQQQVPPVLAIPTPSPQPPASVEGLALQGVLGGGRSGGAILLLPGGQQRLIRVGREFRPGLTLKEIGVSHAILGTSSGDVRLDMGRAGGTSAAATQGAAANSRGATAPGRHAREALAYKLGLQPMKNDGRIRGFAIRPEATLPRLQQAGLRSGDVLIAVNGQALESEEKVLELSQEIATSYTAEFEFLRGGRRMKSALQVNPRG